MDLSSVMTIFNMLSHQSGAEFLPLIQLSIMEVKKGLRADADKTDSRLVYLAGAIANLRYIELDCVREKQMLTISGGVAVNSNSSERYELAKRIASEYQGLCTDLLADNDFVFFGTKG